MVETYKQMIEIIENEIAELTRDCEDLEEAKRRTDGRSALSEAQEDMARTIGIACDIAPNLKIMQQFRDDFVGITRGPQVENVSTAISDFLKDLEDERNRRKEQQKEKLRRLSEVNEILRTLMNNVDNNIFGGSGDGGGRIV